MATWDRYKQPTTGLEVKSYLGDIFTVRSYCDDPQGDVFVSKEPVCKLLVTPLSVFINQNFTWDISDSVSSTGTIDTFDIDFDGATSGGDIVAGDWAVDPLTNTNQYTTAGHFTIVGSVTDTLGNKSKEIRIPVIAIDGTSELTEESLQREYNGTTDSGCWILTPAVPPVASNTGLSGDDLKFRDMRVSPYTADDINGNHHIWAATKNGVAYSIDGAANWLTISKATLGDPKNTAGDGTPPVTADLDQIGISLDPQSSNRIYVMRTNATRTWIYWSNDYGVTWDNEQVNRLLWGTTTVILTGGGNAQHLSHARLDTDKSIATFNDNDINMRAMVIDVSAGITLGAGSTLITGNNEGSSIDQADTDKAIVAYGDPSASDIGRVRVLTVSGTTITQQTATTFDTTVFPNVRIGITPDGTKGVIAYKKTGIGMRLCRITISGNTVTADSPVTHSTHVSDGHPLCLRALDNGRILFWYGDNVTDQLFHAQVIDVSGTISQGAVSDLATFKPVISAGMEENCLTILSDTKGVAIFRDATSFVTHLVDINVSGSTISSFGTPLQVGNSADNGGIDKLSTTRGVIVVPESTRIGKTFNDTDEGLVEGSIIEDSVSAGSAYPVFTGNNRAIVLFRNDTTGEANAVILNLVSGGTHSAGGIPGSILI